MAPGAFAHLERLHVFCDAHDSKALDTMLAHLTVPSFPALHTLSITNTHVDWKGGGLVAVTAPIRELSVFGDSMLGECYEHLSHMTALTQLNLLFDSRLLLDRPNNLSGAVSKLASLQQLRALTLNDLHSTHGLGALTQLFLLSMHLGTWEPAMPISEAAFKQGMDLAGELAPLTGLKVLDLHAILSRPARGARLTTLDFVSAVPSLVDLELCIYVNPPEPASDARLLDEVGEHTLAALPHLRRLRLHINAVPDEDPPPLVVGGRRWRRTVDRTSPQDFVVYTPFGA